MDTSFPQAVQVYQVPQATQVDTLTATAAAAAEPAGQQQRKRGRPKGSKDKQPRSRRRVHRLLERKQQAKKHVYEVVEGICKVVRQCITLYVA